MKTVLVLGGTFDPVHNAHLQTALDVAEMLGVKQIRLIPCGDPAHRPAPGATADQRAAMLQAAIAEQPRFVIDRQELERDGPSYMVDTAANLRRELGPSVSIVLMMGMDAFLGLPNWHRWQQLLSYLHLLVVERPGWQREMCQANSELQQLLAEHQVSSVAVLNDTAAGGILMAKVSHIDISATEIRRMIAIGESCSGLLPDAVTEFIEKQKIYQNQV